MTIGVKVIMSSDDMQALVARYKQLVLQYEGLDETIDALLMRFDGGTEKMPPEEYQHYRTLARQRDEVFSEMSNLEQILFRDDDTDETA